MCGRAGRSRLCPSAQLEALHPQFASIDSLPLLGLPLTTIPWILLALGAALIALGVVIWRARGRAPLLVAAALGLAMLVVPLALSYPGKPPTPRRSRPSDASRSPAKQPPARKQRTS
jgi:hypothetical protein